MTPAAKHARFRVLFDDAYLAEDLAHSTPEGQRVARDARPQLQRHGAPGHLLVPSDDEHRDGTDLAGLPHLYLPMPYGPWGIVLEAGRDNTGLYLAVIAFGLRHPDRRPSVYDVAHYRRHGQWPTGMHRRANDR